MTLLYTAWNFVEFFLHQKKKLGLAHICKVEEEKMNEWKL